MSKKSQANTETQAELEKRLEEALQRVVSLEQQKLVPQLDHILTLAGQKEEILAAQIFARKERQCPARAEQRMSPDEEKEELYEAIQNRHIALLNHKTVKRALQSACLNVQMKESVWNGLQKVDVEETMDHFTKRGELLSHCGSNFHECKELAALVNQKDELDKEIFQIQRKYSATLKEIRQKWESLEDRVMEASGESKAIVEMQEKTKVRESRVQLLVTMIQGLISTCGFQWGASEYYIQVMQLCDSVMKHQDTATQNAIMNKILKIRRQKEDTR